MCVAKSKERNTIASLSHPGVGETVTILLAPQSLHCVWEWKRSQQEPTKMRSSSSRSRFSSWAFRSACLLLSCSRSNLLVRSLGGLMAYFLSGAFSSFLTNCHPRREEGSAALPALFTDTGLSPTQLALESGGHTAPSACSFGTLVHPLSSLDLSFSASRIRPLGPVLRSEDKKMPQEVPTVQHGTNRI